MGIFIDYWDFSFFEVKLGQSAFVINRHSSAVEYGVLNIINADVLTKDRDGIFVLPLSVRLDSRVGSTMFRSIIDMVRARKKPCQRKGP